MEAAKPAMNITPINESDLTFNQIKEYKIYLNEKEYLIQLGKTPDTEKLGFKIKENISNIKYLYEISLSLDELKNINKSFRSFDNVDEALLGIDSIFQDNNVDLKIEGNNLFLILKLNKIGKGKELVEINLEKKELLENEDQMKISKKIKALEDEIYYLKNALNDIILWKKSISPKLESLISKEDNSDKIINYGSYIINEKDEFDLIDNRLRYMAQFKNKNISYKLIFRATQDGELSSDLHNKVDGKDKTITIIETTKGLKFGGYIDKRWDNYSKWIKSDENCFVFSLSLRKIYNPIKGKNKYMFSNDCGPNFTVFGLGANLFEISSLNTCTSDIANKSFSGFTADYELTGGDDEFQIKELEIFQVIVD